MTVGRPARDRPERRLLGRDADVAPEATNSRESTQTLYCKHTANAQISTHSLSAVVVRVRLLLGGVAVAREGDAKRRR